MRIILPAFVLILLMPLVSPLSSAGSAAAGPAAPAPAGDALVGSGSSSGTPGGVCTGWFEAVQPIPADAVAGFLRMDVKEDCSREVTSVVVGPGSEQLPLRTSGTSGGVKTYPVTYYKRIWHEVRSGDFTGPNIRTYQVGEWTYDRYRVYTYRTAYSQCEEYGTWDATCGYHAEPWGSNAARFTTTLDGANSFGHYVSGASSKTYVEMNGYVYAHTCAAGYYALRAGGYVECNWGYA